MPDAPREPEAQSRRRRGSASDRDTSDRQEEIDAFLGGVERLVQAAGEAGRDLKLVDALLHTMVGLLLEAPRDLLESPETPLAEPVVGGESATTPIPPRETARRRLRVEYALRLRAVIDSWSDDETADFLMIGRRQVQRRAQQGSLYYFLVNRKRRYPVWQFDRFCGVVGGVEVVGQVLPKSWPPERVYAFMTALSPALEHRTPAQWLLANRDPHQITAILASMEDR